MFVRGMECMKSRTLIYFVNGFTGPQLNFVHTKEASTWPSQDGCKSSMRMPRSPAGPASSRVLCAVPAFPCHILYVTKQHSN